jgi:hypothetical protein
MKVSSLESLARRFVQVLQWMDEECLTGLCDYAQLVGLKGRDEAGLTFGVTKHLIEDGVLVEQKEHLYPQDGSGKRPRCDRVLLMPDGSRIWLEVKDL